MYFRASIPVATSQFMDWLLSAGLTDITFVKESWDVRGREWGSESECDLRYIIFLSFLLYFWLHFHTKCLWSPHPLKRKNKIEDWPLMMSICSICSLLCRVTDRKEVSEWSVYSNLRLNKFEQNINQEMVSLVLSRVDALWINHRGGTAISCFLLPLAFVKFPRRTRMAWCGSSFDLGQKSHIMLVVARVYF